MRREEQAGPTSSSKIPFQRGRTSLNASCAICCDDTVGTGEGSDRRDRAGGITRGVAFWTRSGDWSGPGNDEDVTGAGDGTAIAGGCVVTTVVATADDGGGIAAESGRSETPPRSSSVLDLRLPMCLPDSEMDDGLASMAPIADIGTGTAGACSAKGTSGIGDPVGGTWATVVHARGGMATVTE